MSLHELRDWAARCPGVMKEPLKFWARVFELCYPRVYAARRRVSQRINRWLTRCDHCGSETAMSVARGLCPFCRAEEAVGTCLCGCGFSACECCLTGVACQDTGHSFVVKARWTDSEVTA